MSLDDDIEIADIDCPKCGNYTNRKPCFAIHCEDGYIDESEYDPINYVPGELYFKCDECNGHGSFLWCPKCGYDLLNETTL